jgi:hypothetical protein
MLHALKKKDHGFVFMLPHAIIGYTVEMEFVKTVKVFTWASRLNKFREKVKSPKVKPTRVVDSFMFPYSADVLTCHIENNIRAYYVCLTPLILKEIVCSCENLSLSFSNIEISM